MDNKTRRLLLFQLSGYFRTTRETADEGIGNGMEKMLLIGLAYGAGGRAGALQSMNLLGVPSHYTQAIIDTLEDK